MASKLDVLGFLALSYVAGRRLKPGLRLLEADIFSSSASFPSEIHNLGWAGDPGWGWGRHDLLRFLKAVFHE